MIKWFPNQMPGTMVVQYSDHHLNRAPPYRCLHLDNELVKDVSAIQMIDIQIDTIQIPTVLVLTYIFLGINCFRFRQKGISKNSCDSCL